MILDKIGGEKTETLQDEISQLHLKALGKLEREWLSVFFGLVWRDDDVSDMVSNCDTPKKITHYIT